MSIFCKKLTKLKKNSKKLVENECYLINKCDNYKN